MTDSAATSEIASSLARLRRYSLSQPLSWTVPYLTIVLLYPIYVATTALLLGEDWEPTYSGLPVAGRIYGLVPSLLEIVRGDALFYNTILYQYLGPWVLALCVVLIWLLRRRSNCSTTMLVASEVAALTLLYWVTLGSLDLLENLRPSSSMFRWDLRFDLVPCPPLICTIPQAGGAVPLLTYGLPAVVVVTIGVLGLFSRRGLVVPGCLLTAGVLYLGISLFELLAGPRVAAHEALANAAASVWLGLLALGSAFALLPERGIGSRPSGATTDRSTAGSVAVTTGAVSKLCLAIGVAAAFSVKTAADYVGVSGDLGAARRAYSNSTAAEALSGLLAASTQTSEPPDHRFDPNGPLCGRSDLPWLDLPGRREVILPDADWPETARLPERIFNRSGLTPSRHGLASSATRDLETILNRAGWKTKIWSEILGPHNGSFSRDLDVRVYFAWVSAPVPNPDIERWIDRGGPLGGQVLSSVRVEATSPNGELLWSEEVFQARRSLTFVVADERERSRIAEWGSSREWIVKKNSPECDLAAFVRDLNSSAEATQYSFLRIAARHGVAPGSGDRLHSAYQQLELRLLTKQVEVSSFGIEFDPATAQMVTLLVCAGMIVAVLAALERAGVGSPRKVDMGWLAATTLPDRILGTIAISTICLAPAAIAAGLVATVSASGLYVVPSVAFLCSGAMTMMSIRATVLMAVARWRPSGDLDL